MGTSAKILGGLLEFVRKKQNVTRTQLAASVGVTEDYLRQFEEGEINFEFDELDVMVKGLGLDNHAYYDCMQEYLSQRQE